MILYHVTHKNRYRSINHVGLRLEHSRTSPAKLWLVSASRVNWAMRHVSKTHHWDIKDMTVMEVQIPRRWSMRGSSKSNPSSKKIVRYKRGIWQCYANISPDKLVWVEET